MRSALMLAVAVLVFLGTVLNVDSVVVGVDFGSEKIKTALVQAGTPFHIVVDEQTSRAVPAQVCFDKKQRLFGNDATSSAVRKSKDTVRFMHRLLGKSMDSPQLKQLTDFGYPFDFEAIEERGAIGVKLLGEVYSPEEVVAMSLEHIMKICHDDTEGIPVKDLVLTVPAWFTQNERVALIDAAEMAGWNVLSLINQNTAAALQFGIDRKFNETAPAHNVIFYNMGTSGTEVSLAEYTAYAQKGKGRQNKTIGQFEMKGVTFDQNLGGGILDNSITNFIVEEYLKSNPTVDIRSMDRPMAKIRVASARAKKVLSANTDSPIFVASLHDDVDFKSFITRDILYSRNEDYLERLLTPLKQLLEDLKMEITDVDELVIIGGAVRVPAVKNKLKEFLGRQLAESLNGDESMALGAVFRAANLSTAFQVRKIGMVDVTPYPVGVRFSDIASGEETVEETEGEETEGEESDKPKGFSKRAQLFKRFNRLAKRKTVGFSHDKDFACSMHFDSAAKYLPEGISPIIALYNITGLNDLITDPANEQLLADGQVPRVALSFSLSSSGIVSLIKAEATLEEMVEVKVPIKKNKTEETVDDEATPDSKTNETDTEEKKEEGEEGDAAEEEKKDEDKKEEEATPAEGDEEKKEEETEKKEDEEEKEEVIEYETKLEKRSRTFTLKVESGYPKGAFNPMSSSDIKVSKETLSGLAKKDKLMVDVAVAKNNLESNIYDVRSKIDDEEIEQVATEEQIAEVRTLLSESEDWLYDQGDDDAQIFKDKLTEISEKSGPIFFRAEEIEARPTAIESLEKLAENVRLVLADIAENRTWIPAEDMEELEMKIVDVEEWVQKMTTLQTAMALTEEPAWTSIELSRKLPPIAKKAQELLKRQKPKPKKEKKEKKAKKAKKEEEGDEDLETPEVSEDSTEGGESTEETTDETAEKSTEETETETEGEKEAPIEEGEKIQEETDSEL